MQTRLIQTSLMQTTLKFIYITNCHSSGIEHWIITDISEVAVLLQYVTDLEDAKLDMMVSQNKNNY